jgi:mRNA interferase HicA
VETHKGDSGHVTVIRGDRKSQVPVHGGKKEELGTALVNKIKRDLGID